MSQPFRMEWEILTVTATREDIKKAVADVEWQKFRFKLNGYPLEERRIRLGEWLRDHKMEWPARVQVSNYVNALKRGGLI